MAIIMRMQDSEVISNMKKRVLALTLGLCLAVTATTACGSDEKEEKKKTESTTGSAAKAEAEEDLIPAEDDNVEKLHEYMMERVGQYAEKYVTLPEYTGMAVEVAAKQEITDKVYEENMNNMLATYPFTFEGEVASGTTVNIDYEGKVNGVAFDGGKDEAFDLQIGSGKFIEGFEEQLIGMKVGDTKVIDVTFPTSYHVSDLAGKKAQFTVKANYIIPESGKGKLTEQWIDAYLKKAGAVLTDASVDGFKKYFRDLLETNAETERKNNEEYAILEKLVDTSKLGDYSKEQYDYYFGRVSENLEASLYSSYQMTPEQYIEQLGITQEEYDEMVKTSTTNQMKYEYSIIMIGEKEGIKPTEEDYKALLQEYATSSGVDLETFRKQHQASYQMDLYLSVYADKVVEHLLKSAKITDAVEDASGEAATAQ